MLYRLGKIISKSSINSSLIFESNYTGYVINVNNVDNFEIDKFQKIFIFDYKHDYEKTYYGFKEFMERVLFKDLLSIQGLGPKTAMSVLSFDWKEVANMIANGDYNEIAKIPCIGLRTARQIVFDFQEKYKTILNKKTESKNKLEVYKTLRCLGFNENHIDLVSKQLEDKDDIDEMIENAIEIISNAQNLSNK